MRFVFLCHADDFENLIISSSLLLPTSVGRCHLKFSFLAFGPLCHKNDGFLDRLEFEVD